LGLFLGFLLFFCNFLLITFGYNNLVRVGGDVNKIIVALSTL